jgi:hypothetical protein
MDLQRMDGFTNDGWIGRASRCHIGHLVLVKEGGAWFWYPNKDERRGDDIKVIGHLVLVYPNKNVCFLEYYKQVIFQYD